VVAKFDEEPNGDLIGRNLKLMGEIVRLSEESTYINATVQRSEARSQSLIQECL
jgi:hypothetical protein